MKKILFIFSLLVSFSITNYAQGEYTAENEGWLVKMDEAYAISKKTGKPILANFTGSDWCGWCKRLVADVFSQPDFKKWAEKNVVLLELDFPRRKTIPEDIRQQNFSLQQSFGVRGYPTIFIFHADKDANNGNYSINTLGRTGYKKTVDEFTSEVNEMIKNGKG
jgi:thioredoxin-related protein